MSMRMFCYVCDQSYWIPCEKLGIENIYNMYNTFVKLTLMTNSLVGDHQVAVVDLDEGVLEGSDMSGTQLNRFLVKN